MRRAAYALCCLLASGCATLQVGGANVPSFPLQDTHGRTHFLTDYIGRKVVVMSFWATWCQPCRQELLMLEEVFRAHKEEGLMVLAINTDGPETQPVVRSFVIQQRLTYPVLLDTETRVVALYNPRKQMPMMHVFNRSGRIAYSHSTFQPGEAASIKGKILSVLHRGSVQEEKKPVEDEEEKGTEEEDKTSVEEEKTED